MQQALGKEIAKAWEGAWNNGDYAPFRSLLSDDFERVSKGTESSVNADGFIRQIDEMRSAFPDMTTTLQKVLPSGEDIGFFWTTEGTFTRPLGNVPPTGRRVTTSGATLATIKDGKIAHEQATWNMTALLADLGLPSLASAFETTDPEAPDNDETRERLKDFNKQFVTGVTVITAHDDDGMPRGLAANAYCSVSLDPPLILVCVQKTSSTYPSLFRSGHIGINILSTEQHETLQVFASKSQDKFANVPWHKGPNGTPLLYDSSASIEVEIKERFQALTHTIFIGRVRHAEAVDNNPILYKAGKFFDSQGLQPL
ncbi:flavin reductase [Yaniella halotolerans]|uniref:flavin reductase n=1 Tax=Yaniella halotolerans TaxID=225453 RepID=UPI0003B718C6|nr:flavin reductase [Yaniella halotolerans]